MNTKEAFKTLCLNKAKCLEIGMKDNTRLAYISYLKVSRYISLDKMEEWLIKAGLTVKQEKLWKINFL